MIEEVIDEIVKAEEEAAAIVQDAYRQADALEAEGRTRAEQCKTDADAEIKRIFADVAAQSETSVAAASEKIFAEARDRAQVLEAAGEKRMQAAVDLIVKKVLEL